jgi:hypothetical protein
MRTGKQRKHVAWRGKEGAGEFWWPYLAAGRCGPIKMEAEAVVFFSGVKRRQDDRNGIKCTAFMSRIWTSIGGGGLLVRRVRDNSCVNHVLSASSIEWDLMVTRMAATAMISVARMRKLNLTHCYPVYSLPSR